MEYKLVAIDLDDTLLKDDLKISPNTIEAIQEAVNKGVTITLATGRMFQSALKYAKEINLNVPIITYHGAYVKNIIDGNVLYERLLSYEISIELIKKLKEMGKDIQLYLNDELYAEKSNKHVEEYSRIVQVECNYVEDLIDLIAEKKVLPMKVLAIDDPTEIKVMYEEFKELYKDKIHVTISKPHFLEFSHIEATKGQAIKHLATHLGISIDEVIAIGDSYNDWDMIEMAGLGVAMGNSHPEIKKIANYITKSNNDDGVSEVLHKFILNTAMR